MTRSFMSIGKILAEDQNRAELFYGYTVTRTSEKAGSECSGICTFLSNIGLAHLLFASFPPVSKKQEKFYTLCHLLGFGPALRPEKLHCLHILLFYLNQRTTRFGCLPAGKLTSLPEREASRANSLLPDIPSTQPTTHFRVLYHFT